MVDHYYNFLIETNLRFGFYLGKKYAIKCTGAKNQYHHKYINL